MVDEDRTDLIRRMMGASHVFCTTVNELLERSLAAASDGEVVLSQVRLLLLISRPDQCYKVTDVAEFLGVTNAAASRSIDRLVQRGLVDRTTSEADRRAVDLSLTRKGASLLDRFEEARYQELWRALGELPEEELLAAVSLLDRLSVRLAGLETDDEGCPRCGVHFRETCLMSDALGRDCPRFATSPPAAVSSDPATP